MTAFLRFLVKESTEIRRTWRLPTMGGVLLFFAVMSPLAALATPAILASVSASQPGVFIKVPDPTHIDSYAQWIKNLSQMGLLLIVFGSAGLIAGERTAGTAILVVTKPVSRFSFVAAKYVAQAALVTIVTLAGTLVTLAGTRLAFGTAPAGVLVLATAAWLASALLLVAVTEVFSAVLPTLAAGIAGLVTWWGMGLSAIWEPIARYTPAGLLGAPGAILAGSSEPLVWPLVTTVATVLVLVAAAGWLFAKREL